MINQKRDFVFVQGRSVLPALPEELRQLGNAIGLLSGDTASCVGVAANSRGRITVLPSTYRDLTDEEERRAVRLLEQVLIRYEGERRVTDEEASGETISKGSTRWLIGRSSAHSLWIDFVKFGSLRVDEQKRSLLPRGRADWARTMSAGEWIQAGASKTMLPAQVHYRFRDGARSDVVGRVHSWLVRVGAEIEGATRAAPLPPPPVSARAAIAAVKHALKQSFRRRERRVFGLMLEALNGDEWPTSEPRPGAESFYVVATFERVWEDILRRTISGKVVALNLPAGKWDHTSTKGISPLPDLIRARSATERNDLIIIDAKYYREAWATADDHYKQIIYARLATHLGFSVVANVLVFAATVPTRTGSWLRFSRSHSWVGIPDSRVSEVLCDYERSARAYIEESTERVDLDDLLIACRPLEL